MRNRLLRKENYKSRWFILTTHNLRYYDGNFEVEFQSVTVLLQRGEELLGVNSSEAYKIFFAT